MTADGKNPVLCVVGATASGKSELAMRLCLALNGELVGCDSMQIYRRMDIGTAKPTEADRKKVRHHMVDCVDPCTPYSCADYAADAVRCTDDICSRGKLPVICGGTGLYLDALLFKRPWDESGGRSDIRDRLAAEAAAVGNHALWERLYAVDPESAEKIHENNVRRVIRALEIFEISGRTKSELDRSGGEARYGHLVLWLRRPDREAQWKRIEARVDRMLADGLAEETAALERDGIFESNTTAAQAIGYKEMLGYLHGECTLADARERLIIATRQYAKRQNTWFAAKKYAVPVDIDENSPDPFPAAMKIAAERLGAVPEK